MGKGILVYFLKKHGSEVLNMLYTKWNWDDAKEVWQEEAEARGVKKLLALLEGGMSLPEAKSKLGLSGYTPNPIT
jgi:hypothetical protein